ncbi:porin family protein [Mucilaginibacter sp.]|jgi:hypothetical protein|uniref:porin family protein n=1 Tax=Mucilaginibacter sp. TaxID=1882438 RepID=UPI0035613A51
MKLKPTLFIFLIIACFKVSAQTRAIQFGIKGSINAVTLSRTLEQDFLVSNPEKALTGFSAGVFASFNMDRFALQPGVFFTARGGKTTEGIVLGDIAFRAYGNWRLYYIQVPVNLVYHIPVKTGSFYLGAGPYIARGLKGKFTPQTLDNNSIDESDQNDFNIKAQFGNDNNSNFKSFDYGVNGIAGFQFNNGILVNAGYDLGLSNIQTNNILLNPTFYNSTKNRSFNISIGYMFK